MRNFVIVVLILISRNRIGWTWNLPEGAGNALGVLYSVNEHHVGW
jgi:hypothetical protein